MNIARAATATLQRASGGADHCDGLAAPTLLSSKDRDALGYRLRVIPRE